MFDVGEKVVCIDDKFPDWVVERYTELPKDGQIYVIRDLIPASDYGRGETCAVLLIGIVGDINKHGIENGFAARRFRPLEEVMEERKKAHQLEVVVENN